MADGNDKNPPNLKKNMDSDKQEIEKVKGQVSTKSIRYLKLKIEKSCET